MPSAETRLVWTLRAHRRLEQILARASDPDRDQRMTELQDVLAASFPGATVVVLDLFLGYRPRPGEFVALVEATGGPAEGPYIVKVGPPERLRTELDAWHSCRPHGLRHDVVLMAVEPRRDKNGALRSLVYEDAQQAIGTDRTTTLEDAFLGAVAHDAPTVESLAAALAQLFHRLGQLLYRAAHPVDPAGSRQFRKVAAALPRWRAEPAAVAARREVSAAVPARDGVFLDPVDFFAALLAEARDQPAGRLLPRVLGGKAHGDLHGRNVLVGLVRDQVHWPAVFDYEDMADDNLVAWDFVKLETELKIRACERLFADQFGEDYARRVREFEAALAAKTEACRRLNRWPPPARSDVPAERLLTLLLAVRRLAALYLGDEHGRAGDWLEEYYLLLAAYGLCTVRYPNLSTRERVAAFVSAGVAVDRFATTRRDWGLVAEPSAENLATVLGRIYPSYHAPLQVAWTWSRKQTADSLELSRRLLVALKERYPDALAVRYELAFALANLKRPHEARAELEAAGRDFPVLSEEVLNLWGRLAKDAGDAALAAGVPAEAYRNYLAAQEKYERAFDLTGGRFAGINAATVQLVLASIAPAGEVEARQKMYCTTARRLLDGRAGWREELPDDNIWVRATEAEAWLLLQEWDAAAGLYRAALAQPNVTPFHVAAMRRQVVERILPAFRRLGVTPAGPFADPGAVFAPPG